MVALSEIEREGLNMQDKVLLAPTRVSGMWTAFRAVLVAKLEHNEATLKGLQLEAQQYTPVNSKTGLPQIEKALRLWGVK